MFRQFQRKTFALEPLVNKVVGLKTYNFIHKRLQHGRFPVKFAMKILRTPILNNICERLILLFLTFHGVTSNRVSEFNGDLVIDLWVRHRLHGIKDCDGLM